MLSVKVAALTEGVMKTMLLNKLKMAIASVLILGFMGTGATVLTFRTLAAQSDKIPIGSGNRIANDGKGDERPKTGAAPTQNDKPAPQATQKSADPEPLGHILRITAQGDKVYINLGKADNIRPKMAFSVYGAGANRANRSPKAHLEVLTVLASHLSLAQATSYDPDREPLVQGDQLYHLVPNPTQVVGQDETTKQEQKRPGQPADKHSPSVGVYNGDNDVEKLVHQYRGLADNDKLGQDGERIRERLLLLSRSDQVTLSPFARDALAGILAEHRLRQLLRAATQRSDKTGRE
jgi:hypothetical protein